MTVVAGTTPASGAAIANATSAMALPKESIAPQVSTNVPPETTPAPQPNTLVQTPTAPIPNVSQAKTDADAGANLVNGVEIPTFADEPPAVEAPPEPPADDDESDLPKDPGAENFKKLRGVIKETRKAKKEIEAENLTLKERVEKYEKGELVPDIIRAKDEKIAQLEPLKKIYDLKNSDEYIENFVRPAGELRSKLDKMGADYGMSPEFMQQLVQIESRKELNSYLDRYFGETGGLEVKQVIDELQDLGNRAIEAEKEPAEALQTLRAQHQERLQAEMRERATIFETTAKDAWQQALEKTAKEGAYKELVKHPTDAKFNKEVVEPIQYRASVQYGALVKQLAQNGLKVLPPELASGLARMVLLSIGGAMQLGNKAKAEKAAQELIINTRRDTSLIRPSSGQNGTGAHRGEAGQPRKYLDPKSAQDQVKI